MKAFSENVVHQVAHVHARTRRTHSDELSLMLLFLDQLELIERKIRACAKLPAVKYDVCKYILHFVYNGIFGPMPVQAKRYCYDLSVLVRTAELVCCIRPGSCVHDDRAKCITDVVNVFKLAEHGLDSCCVGGALNGHTLQIQHHNSPSEDHTATQSCR